MKRSIYSHLKQWKKKKHRRPLILKGARQVGKTYILKKFGMEHFENFHYINFEEDRSLSSIFEKNLKVKRIVQELQFYLDKPINIKHDLLIMDEIQVCPNALTSLKYFNEQMPDFSICAAGSLLGVHLGEASFPVGKVDFLDLFPMSFREFLEASRQDMLCDFLDNLTFEQSIPETVHEKLWELFKIYLVVGGLPYIVQTYVEFQENLFECLNQVRKAQKDLVKTYLADIAKHSGKINSMHIERMLRNIPSQLARQQDGSAPKFRFKGVIPGIRGYSRLANVIDWLEAAGLIYKIHIINRAELPFSAYSKENTFKLIMFDVGLLGALGDLPVKSLLDYNFGTYKGYVAENFVAQEFVCKGISPLYSWKENTSELEFVIESQAEILPVEVKSGWVTQAKSLKVFSEKYNPEYRTVFSGRNLKIDIENRVHQYPLYLASHFPLV